VFIFFVPLPV